ncbi:NADP-dependent isocitrate dehydrogenase, partial [Thiomicrospira sp.]|uniref:NADP-dependent isocitrate dehydrogenase n=1 Tax=Thiomicrospira sp. TaxID=935 RepID=UPI002F95562F
EHLANQTQDPKAKVLVETLNQATSQFLDNDKSPGRKLGELDNRGSHFYLALYWAQALAKQSQDTQLQQTFKAVAQSMTENEAQILAELKEAQGQPVELGGYYHPNEAKTYAVMRPSATLNRIIDGLLA